MDKYANVAENHPRLSRQLTTPSLRGLNLIGGSVLSFRICAKDLDQLYLNAPQPPFVHGNSQEVQDLTEFRGRVHFEALVVDDQNPAPLTHPVPEGLHPVSGLQVGEGRPVCKEKSIMVFLPQQETAPTVRSLLAEARAWRGKEGKHYRRKDPSRTPNAWWRRARRNRKEITFCEGAPIHQSLWFLLGIEELSSCLPK